MSNVKLRTRAGAALAAVATAASIFALAAPASADPVTPDPVTITAVTVTGQSVKVDWAPAIAGQSPTNYLVTLEKASTPYGTIEYSQVISDPDGTTPYDLATTHTFTNVAPETYYAFVYAVSNGGNTPSDGFGPFVVAPVVVQPPTSTRDYRAYRPYAGWNQMISAEYKMMLGCGDLATGRPRLDELTFWRYAIAEKPFTSGEAAYQVTRYNDRLNELLFDADGAGTNAFAEADTNRDNIIQPAELAAAQSKANDRATNDVFFERRRAFITWLAEDAEQTDGPAYRLYVGVFDRAPDKGGLCYWSKKLRARTNGRNLLSISEFFVKSAEFKRTYGEYDVNAPENGTDAAEFVALIYKNVLNRTPDGSGFAFWTRQLQTGRKGPGEVMIGFTESQEFKIRLNNRVGTTVGFLHLLNLMPTTEDIVLADIRDNEFATSPNNAGNLYNGDGRGLYEYIIDRADYISRALAIPFP